ncbi:hypothetical protein [Alloalcanivorax mobilis]|uniref:hypothetical protein n=1 Tax=Alloalcanivorax mobilis TaxID=2019569 RepID=UPI0013001331|nr:hypothetical protein [Alloalcanivorax mobilis]
MTMKGTGAGRGCAVPALKGHLASRKKKEDKKKAVALTTPNATLISLKLEA